MSPQIGEVAQPGLISKRQFKGQGGWGQVGQQGGGLFGKSGNTNNQSKWMISNVKSNLKSRKR